MSLRDWRECCKTEQDAAGLRLGAYIQEASSTVGTTNCKLQENDLSTALPLTHSNDVHVGLMARIQNSGSLGDESAVALPRKGEQFPVPDVQNTYPHDRLESFASCRAAELQHGQLETAEQSRQRQQQKERVEAIDEIKY